MEKKKIYFQGITLLMSDSFELLLTSEMFDQVSIHNLIIN